MNRLGSARVFRVRRSWSLLFVLILLASGVRSNAQPQDGPQIRTVVGSPIYDASRPLNRLKPGYEPDDHPNAAMAKLWAPMGLAVDRARALFLVDALANDVVGPTRGWEFQSAGPCEPCPDDGPLFERVRKVKEKALLTVAMEKEFQSANHPRENVRVDTDVEIPCIDVSPAGTCKYSGELYVLSHNSVMKITPGKEDEDDKDEEVEAIFTDPQEKVICAAGACGDMPLLNPAGAADGSPGTAGGFSEAMDLAFDDKGNMFVTSPQVNVIRKVAAGTNGVIDGCTEKVEGVCQGDPDEVWTTVAGVPAPGQGAYSGENVPARSAQLFRPGGLAFDSQGNMYISDTYNHRIRKVTAGRNKEVDGADDEIITTVAGKGEGSAYEYGYGRDEGAQPSPRTAGKWGWNGEEEKHPKVAYLDTPRHIEIDKANNLYIADSENDRVRKITPGGDGELGTVDDRITTVAGRNEDPAGRDGNHGVPTRAGESPPQQPDRCYEQNSQGASQPPCSPTDVKLELPYGLALAPCRDGSLTTEMYVSEWMNRRVREVSGVAQCPKMDLWLEDITDTPDPVTVGSDLKYSIKATNTGPSEATGVKVTNTLPAGPVFKSATFSGVNCNLEGAFLVCPVGRLRAGESVNIEVTVTPVTPGEISLTSSLAALNPEEKNNVQPNSATETTQVVLSALRALPCVVGCGGGSGGSTDGPPSQGSKPPGAGPVDTNQSSITVTTPPGGPASAAPSTVPVSSPASLPLGQQVPLTGSLGFQPGPASAVAPASVPAVPELVGAGGAAGSALADASDEQQSEPALGYSMVSQETALQTEVSLTAALLLAGLACMVVIRPLPSRAAPAAGWGSGSRPPTPDTRPAL